MRRVVAVMRWDEERRTPVSPLERLATWAFLAAAIGYLVWQVVRGWPQ